MIPRSARGIAVIVTGGALTIALFSTCDAPRDNPLDPENPRNPFGVIAGAVEEEATQQPLEGARVYWSADGKTAFTDEFGAFSIIGATPSRGELVVEKDGYFTRSVSLEWSGGLRERVTVPLTPAPTAQFKIYSEAQLTYNYKSHVTLARVELALEGAASVDSTLLIAPKIDLRRSLGTFANIETKYFAFSLGELGVEDEWDLIGVDFKVVVKRGAEEFVVAEDFIERVFNVQVRNVSPISGGFVNTPQPVFEWTPAKDSVDFPFTYQIIISYDVGASDPLGEITKIPSDSSRVVSRVALDPGQYKWAIYMVDEHKNRCRSPEFRFEVIY